MKDGIAPAASISTVKGSAEEGGFSLRRLAVFAGWLAIIIAAYSLERLEFLWANWRVFSGESRGDIALALLHGLRFDASFVFMTAAPFLPVLLTPFPSRWRGRHDFPRWFVIVFLAVELPWLLINLIDGHYYPFAGRRSTFGVFGLSRDFVEQGGQLLGQYWFVPLLALLGATSIFLAMRRLTQSGAGRSVGWKGWSAVSLAAVAFSLVAIRGGCQLKPLRPTQAYLFSSTTLGDLTLNTPYVMVRTGKKESVPALHLLASQDDVDRLTERDRQLIPHFASSKDNVVIIILESFGLELMGEPNHRATAMPFLESLSRRGLFFVNNHANGRRSVEAVPAILAGIPSLMDEPYATSSYVGNRMHGLGEILSSRGYRTAFFHGGKNGTMYFDKMSRLAGFSDYYGLSEYPDGKDFDGAWGIYDGPFLKFMRAKLDATREPFAAAVFTLSSHNPFPVPADFAAKADPKLTPFKRSVAYADQALGEFFREAAKAPWYKHTLFVLTADHTAESVDPAYQTLDGRYRVPLIFFHGGGRIAARQSERVTQHVDILPSVLDFLGIASSDVGYRLLPFGRSVFDDSRPGLAVNQASGRYWLKREGSLVSCRLPDAGKNAVDPRLAAYIQLFNNGINESSWYQDGITRQLAGSR